MSIVTKLSSRRLSFSGGGRSPLSLEWLYGDLCCHSEDEIYLQGGMTLGPTPPFACKFTPDGLYGNLLAVGDEEGSVRLFDTRRPLGHTDSMISELHAHSNAIFDLAWIPGGTKLLTGSGDRSVCLWDVVGMQCLATFKAHLGSVKVVDVRKEEPSMFVSGSRDGSITVWDTRCATKGSQHRPVNRISMAHKKAGSAALPRKKGRGLGLATPTSKSGDCQHGVTAVVFHGDNKLASTGAVDGVVKLWDLRRTYSSCRVEPPPAWHVFESTNDHSRSFGFTSLVSDSYQTSLFACCTNDIVYMYNSSTLSKKPVGAFSGHKNTTFYVKAALSPDGRHLLSGSSCGRGFLWEVARPEAPPLTLCGHNTEVTAVHWSPTLDKIATCSDNNDVRIWRIVRNRSTDNSGNSLPGEYIGSCHLYEGNGHLKGQEVLKKTLAHDNDTSRAVPERAPLQSIQDSSSSSANTPTTANSSNTRNPEVTRKKKSTTLLHFLQPSNGGDNSVSLKHNGAVLTLLSAKRADVEASDATVDSEPSKGLPTVSSDVKWPDLGYGSLESDIGSLESLGSDSDVGRTENGILESGVGGMVIESGLSPSATSLELKSGNGNTDIGSLESNISGTLNSDKTSNNATTTTPSENDFIRTPSSSRKGVAAKSELPTSKSRELTPENHSQTAGCNTHATSSTRKRKLILDTPPRTDDADEGIKKSNKVSDKNHLIPDKLQQCAVCERQCVCSNDGQPATNESSNSKLQHAIQTGGAGTDSLPPSTLEPQASYKRLQTQTEDVSKSDLQRKIQTGGVDTDAVSPSSLEPPCKRQRACRLSEEPRGQQDDDDDCSQLCSQAKGDGSSHKCKRKISQKTISTVKHKQTATTITTQPLLANKHSRTHPTNQGSKNPNSPTPTPTAIESYFNKSIATYSK